MESPETIRLHDKTFRVWVPYAELSEAIGKIAEKINHDYKDKGKPFFLGVLNGSFMFMAELMKGISLDCEVSFVKMASYSGLKSSGGVADLIGLAENIEGRHVIIVEDIVDTGASIEHLTKLLEKHKPASVAVAAMLFKPSVYKKERRIDYYAMEAPDKFIVGSGLDYDGLGRNYKDIYELSE